MRKSFSSSMNADNRLPFFFWKGFALNSSSFSWMALLSSSKVKNFRFLNAARIHVSSTLTVPSALGLPFLSVITDKKDYRQKNVISNLILNKRYNRMFRMNCCLLIADNYLIQPAEMEQIFFFSFPFLLRIRYNIAVRVLYRQCFLIYRAKSGSHGLIVCMDVD